MRTTICKTIVDSTLLKRQFLQWSQGCTEVVILDSNTAFNHVNKYSSYDFVVAVDAFTSIKTDSYHAFDDLHQYQCQVKDWIFGYLSYDLKNDVENLTSKNFDGLAFADLYFFQPKKLFLLKNNLLEIHYLSFCDDEIDTDFETISSLQPKLLPNVLNLQIMQRISKRTYLSKVQQLLNYIQQGNLYEANFCMEFYAEDAEIIPHDIYESLQQRTQTPFSCFFKNNTNYLLCASPERFIKKSNLSIISQPIKGTARRFDNSEKDASEKIRLENDSKERSENIMIVDLVRNDLSKTAVQGTVEVEELCKVQSFKQVHQMISTIVSEVAISTGPVAILKSTFPMGSMTGAPKIAAMQIIEELEVTKRGLYSGAMGYFTPDGDFDFNVVIRSILYNSEKKYLSFSVGSAITAAAIPENEYDECMLKADAMLKVLN